MHERPAYFRRQSNFIIPEMQGGNRNSAAKRAGGTESVTIRRFRIELDLPEIIFPGLSAERPLGFLAAGTELEPNGYLRRIAAECSMFAWFQWLS